MSLAEGYGSPAELQQQVFGLREEVNRLRAELAKLREQEPVAEVAKGQHVVLYYEDYVVGGGEISF